MITDLNTSLPWNRGGGLMVNTISVYSDDPSLRSVVNKTWAPPGSLVKSNQIVEFEVTHGVGRGRRGYVPAPFNNVDRKIVQKWSAYFWQKFVTGLPTLMLPKCRSRFLRHFNLLR